MTKACRRESSDNFKKDQSYVSLGYKGASLALALVDISPQGNYVQFVNDISGHGNYVAGIIGAMEFCRGSLEPKSWF